MGTPRLDNSEANCVLPNFTSIYQKLIRFMACIILWIECMNDVAIRVVNNPSELTVYKG